MDNIAVFKMVVLVMVSLLRLAVAVPLYFTAKKNNLRNLYWLSMQFLALVIAIPFAAAGTLDNRWIFWSFISFSEIALIMFIHITFRQGKYSPMPIFMILAVIGFFGGLYGTINDNFELSAWMVYPNAVLIWGWHSSEAYRAYENIANDKSTEDWVKSRYILMITYSVLDFVGSLLGTLLTTNIWINDLGAVLIVGINFISATLQILTWVMPEWLRRHLNRNQQMRQQADVDAHVKTIMNVIGTAMSQDSNISKMMCFDFIRSTIKKKLQVKDDQAINQAINKMGYEEWQLLLNDPELLRLLMNSSASADADKALQNAWRILVRQQSLFTLDTK
jgi:hypothetical protein